jgi:hypothetical protein
MKLEKKKSSKRQSTMTLAELEKSALGEADIEVEKTLETNEKQLFEQSIS